MKKLFLMLCASVLCLAARAALPTYTVTPTDSSSVTDRSAFSVTFTFSESVRVDTVEFRGGERFNRKITLVPISMPTASQTITVAVPDTVWGTPNGQNYLLQVVLPKIYDANGEQYMVDVNEGDSLHYQYAYTASAFYTSPYEEPVTYLGYSPAQGEMSVWDVYYDGYGTVDYQFSGEVSTENASATITFYLVDGNAISQTASGDLLWGDWDFWTGNYVVSVSMVPDALLTSTNLMEIEVSFEGVEAPNGSPIIIPDVLYTNDEQNSIQMNRKEDGQIKCEAIKSHSLKSLYNIKEGVKKQGNEVRNLKPGLYVIDGRKIVVR